MFELLNRGVNVVRSAFVVTCKIINAVFDDVDILAELNEWGPVFTLWSNSEDKLGGTLSGVAKAIEKCYVALQELVSYTGFTLLFWSIT